jgi:glycogen synthase
MMRRARRHIMMTTDTVGGVWVYATSLARTLAAEGDRVTLVTLGPAPNENQRRILDQLSPNIQFVITDLALEWMDPAGKDRRHAAETLLAIAHEKRPDIIHLNGFREGALAWPAPVLVAAHSCVMSWWQACRDGAPTEPRWKIYANGVNAGLCAADAWVAPTAAFRDSIAEIYAPPTEGIVIHNGIDALAERTAPKRDVILASGRIWDCAKGLTTLLAAAPQLPWLVEIAGPTVGPNGEAAPQGANVSSLGELPRDRLLNLMADAAIYVAPTRYEPFGLGILEAAAAGCALVLSDVSTLRELWDDAALFVAPGDELELMAALRTLCADEALRTELQTAARLRARRYTIEATCEQYSALYDAMLGRASPAIIHREARA